MTITLNTVDAFEGKLYSAKKPKRCSVKGNGKKETTYEKIKMYKQNI